MTTASTIPVVGPSAGSSISPARAPSPIKKAPPPRGSGRPAIGDIVLVRLDADCVRPLIVSEAGIVACGPSSAPVEEFRINGTICCEPSDHTTPAFRTLGSTTDPMRIHGRPERTLSVAYGEYLREGRGIGEWQTRPTNLSAGEGR